MKHIPLTQGQQAIVDDADFDWLNRWKWRALKSGKTFYASRAVQRGLRRKTIYMHRFILGLGDGDTREADHIKGDGLDNRRSNLRIATHAENSANRRLSKNNTSGYNGVSWRKREKKWRAQIKVGQKHISLGRYDDPIDAARAYDKAARKHFGEFARTNFSPH